MQKSPREVDMIVGRNVRLLRAQRGISQGELGDALSVTFQQIQKYEKGANRIAASRLYEIASFFGVSVAAMYSGTDAAEKNGSIVPYSADALSVAGAFDQIASAKIRQKAKMLISQLAGSAAEDGAAESDGTAAN